MTSNSRSGGRILGRLRAADGKGVVRIEDRLEGDLRPGGTFLLSTAELDSDGRVDECERPRRLVVTTRETEASYRKGQGAEPFDQVAEATLTADGEQTILVVEVRGMPLDKAFAYGAGWQIHAENLAAYLGGREPDDVEERWTALVPAYQDLAAKENLG